MGWGLPAMPTQTMATGGVAMVVEGSRVVFRLLGFRAVGFAGVVVEYSALFSEVDDESAKCLSYSSYR